MELGEGSKIRPLESDNWFKISEWCGHYNRNNKYPVSAERRYGIGIYQIHQGMEWPDLLNKAESYMSSFLHFQMVCEALKIPQNPTPSFFIRDYPTKPLNAERVLYLISKCQQQIFYAHRAGLTQRGSRYKPMLTGMLMTELQINLVSLVPSHLRLEGLFHASKIMSGVL